MQRSSAYFNVGDEILFGKWKNKRGIIQSITVDPKGNPVVVIQPKNGRKLVEMQLFKIWKAAPTDRLVTKVAAAYRATLRRS